MNRVSFVAFPSIFLALHATTTQLIAMHTSLQLNACVYAGAVRGTIGMTLRDARKRHVLSARDPVQSYAHSSVNVKPTESGPRLDESG